jgi:UDP-N-acetylglucosamine 2-epimerase (non-hydrolysing)
MHITLVAGTRPNFVKISPIIRAIIRAQEQGKHISYSLVHTGQHYDRSMSGSFFEELEIPDPDVNLEVGSGTQAEQTAAILTRFENYLIEHPTDVVLVVGDVTSTMACAIAAKKMNIQLVHVEGGIRSFDMTMPEEINRKVTDSITDHFFTTSSFANDNLKREGVEGDRIHFVGNVMIDTLLYQMERLVEPKIFADLKLKTKEYLVLTLHRPSNVDDAGNLKEILETIAASSRNVPVVFPIHPRTKKVMQEANISVSNLHCIEPQSYRSFNFLVKNALGVITDSGGITEETTVMGIPCLTLRGNTERPETCVYGTNELIGTDPQNLIPNLSKLFEGQWKKGGRPDLWDGKSAERIVQILIKLYGK